MNTVTVEVDVSEGLLSQMESIRLTKVRLFGNDFTPPIGK